MAALCDVYVNDAFGTAHRAEATTHGIAQFAPVAVAGPLLEAELDALGKALSETWDKTVFSLSMIGKMLKGTYRVAGLLREHAGLLRHIQE